jgi:transcriptional regulator with XRE-family HTH domain
MKPEPIYREIGANIRTRRRQADVSQDDVAARVGISRATLANIETGRQRLLVHQLYRLAKVLGAKPSDLLPAAKDDEMPSHLNAVEIHGDVSAEQKKQVVQLIGSVRGPIRNQRK